MSMQTTLTEDQSSLRMLTTSSSCTRNMTPSSGFCGHCNHVPQCTPNPNSPHTSKNKNKTFGLWDTDPGLTNSATIQAQIWHFESVHPNIYPTYELMELMKELVLQNRSCRISKTLGNNRIPERSLSDGPVLVACQKPETLNQTKNL